MSIRHPATAPANLVVPGAGEFYRRPSFLRLDRVVLEYEILAVVLCSAEKLKLNTGGAAAAPAMR